MIVEPALRGLRAREVRPRRVLRERRAAPPCLLPRRASVERCRIGRRMPSRPHRSLGMCRPLGRRRLRGCTPSRFLLRRPRMPRRLPVKRSRSQRPHRRPPIPCSALRRRPSETTPSGSFRLPPARRQAALPVAVRPAPSTPLSPSGFGRRSLRPRLVVRPPLLRARAPEQRPLRRGRSARLVLRALAAALR